MTYQSKVMTVYILGLFMTIIDGTMVNVALPTMADDFGVGTTDIEWIAVGYLLSLRRGHPGGRSARATGSAPDGCSSPH